MVNYAFPAAQGEWIALSRSPGRVRLAPFGGLPRYKLSIAHADGRSEMGDLDSGAGWARLPCGYCSVRAA
jgi:hypothetical protein